MARFVKFPGTAGSYASTPDQNIVDSNTAHLQQSIGSWVSNLTLANMAQAQDITPVFGSFHGVGNPSSEPSDGSMSAWSHGTQELPAVAGQTYSAGIHIATETAGRYCEPYLQFLDAAGAQISLTSFGLFQVPTADTWNFLTLSQVAPALTAYARVLLLYRATDSDWVLTENLYWDAFVIAEGTDATFVPSLRIVGDLDLRAKRTKIDADNTDLLLSNFLTTTGWWWGDTFSTVDGQFILRVDAQNILSTVAPPTPLGTAAVMMVTRDVTTGDTTFYADDVQVGAVVSSTPGAVTYDGAALEAGARAGGTIGYFEGDMYWAEVRDGIDGPIVAQFNAEDIAIP